MAYASWSVTLNEQPSAAKWNILGTNDSYFNSTIGTLASFYWNGGSGTWTYASATTFTVPAADAACMAVGTKIWLTQTTSKYFYVTGVSGTTITVTGGSDYTVANAAITAPYFSNAETPVGFPQWFNFTPAWTNLTPGSGTNTGKFQISGKTAFVKTKFVFGSGSSVGTTPALTFPITSSSTSNTANVTQIGQAGILDSGTAFYLAVVRWVTTTTATPVQINTAATIATVTDISATSPMTWGTSDELHLNITYEIA